VGIPDLNFVGLGKKVDGADDGLKLSRRPGCVVSGGVRNGTRKRDGILGVGTGRTPSAHLAAAASREVESRSHRLAPLAAAVTVVAAAALPDLRTEEAPGIRRPTVRKKIQARGKNSKHCSLGTELSREISKTQARTEIFKTKV
jgi:hypothetical protein